MLNSAHSMLHIAIKPADKLIKGYYDVLGGLGQINFNHEGAVRSAFQNVLAGYGKKLHWTLVPEYAMKGRTGRIAVDGALIDEWKQRHGFWEAKDEHDDLIREIKHKIELGYPTNNTIFQAPEHAILLPDCPSGTLRAFMTRNHAVVSRVMSCHELGPPVPLPRGSFVGHCGLADTTSRSIARNCPASRMLSFAASAWRYSWMGTFGMAGSGARAAFPRYPRRCGASTILVIGFRKSLIICDGTRACVGRSTGQGGRLLGCGNRIGDDHRNYASDGSRHREFSMRGPVIYRYLYIRA